MSESITTTSPALTVLWGATSRSISPESSPVRVAHDHSHRPVLAPAALAALPSTPAIPDRDVFYVARVPAAPFTHCFPRSPAAAGSPMPFTLFIAVTRNAAGGEAGPI